MSRILFFLQVAFAASVLSCGADGDDWPEGQPLIRSVVVSGEVEGSPGHLRFVVEFTDTDGDLERLFVLQDGNQTDLTDIESLFSAQATPLGVSTTQGQFVITVALLPDLMIGDDIRVSFLLEDATGQRSNESGLVLQLRSES